MVKRAQRPGGAGWMSSARVRTKSASELATRSGVASAAAAMAQKFLVDRHEATPFLAFLILEDPAVAARLDGERRCMLDPWGAQLSDVSGGFTTPLARAKVFLIALMVHFRTCGSRSATRRCAVG